jgi:branched-chain amino acid transport system ATP-binding protein
MLLREAQESRRSIWGVISLLELADIHVGYGQGPVLAGVSLRVEKGTVACLLGRNGVGKTTTMRTIMGLLRPDAGLVRFNGQAISGLPAHRIARLGVGYVPEDRRIFPKLTVDENLHVTRTTDTADGWTIARIYELFPDLRERRRQIATTMSGGQQQMLCIARALMGNPHFILLDEPSEGLAPLVIEELATLIIGLKIKGLTILLAEQNLEFARAISDQVYILDKGQVQFSGTFENLMQDSDLARGHLFVDRRQYAALFND